MSKSGKSRNGKQKSEMRRKEVRRNLPKPSADFKAILLRREFIRSTLLVFVLLIVTSMLVIWSRDQVMVRDGQTMMTTQLKRLDFDEVDVTATEAQQLEARRSAPRVYQSNDAYLQRLEASLIGLPTAVAGKSSVADVAPELTASFNLTDDGLAALQSTVADGEPTGQWHAWVQRLIRTEMPRDPIMASEEFQVFSTTPAANRALLGTDGMLTRPLRGEAIALSAIENGSALPRLLDMIDRAGFDATFAPHILALLQSDPQPTLQLDAERTSKDSDAAAEAVQPVLIEHRRGEVLFRRGDILTAAQYDNVLLENRRFGERAGLLDRWLPRVGLIGPLAMLSVFIGGYATLAYPKIAKNPLRLIAICALLASMLAATVLISAEAPFFIGAASIAPTLFATVLIALAYDRRLALLVSAVQAATITLALELGMGWFILIMVGCASMIAQLSDVRNRSTLIRASLLTAIAMGVGVLVLSMFEMPSVTDAWKQIVIQTAMLSTATLAVGFIVLGILPSIERTFGITTGMTLAELTDPRNTLLQQLQQKAPGTYNHSLQVANIAESAAVAIGADGLLAYVGALYHDIGKMNKPEYFVENQSGRFNKHDKLSPAMSLLVIIGYVKDGVELAREYNLPRPLLHFIEAHHGTTLVEYFYHAARQQAEEDPKAHVDEVEFRYPGPKPRSKEVAILMLSDAVESATRSMGDPNPGRIENLVHELSRKRLLDGQFSQCNLTFAELTLIEDAIVSRICSIYHGRVAYPDANETHAADEESNRPQVQASA